VNSSANAAHQQNAVGHKLLELFVSRIEPAGSCHFTARQIDLIQHAWMQARMRRYNKSFSRFIRDLDGLGQPWSYPRLASLLPKALEDLPRARFARVSAIMTSGKTRSFRLEQIPTLLAVLRRQFLGFI
jgi:hypothetical protein